MDLLFRLKPNKGLEILCIIMLILNIACNDKTINGRYAINFHDSIELELLEDTFNLIEIESSSSPNSDIVFIQDKLLQQGTYIVDNDDITLFNKRNKKVCAFKLRKDYKLICNDIFFNFRKSDTLYCIKKYGKNNEEIWMANQINDTVLYKLFYKNGKGVYYNKENQVVKVKK